VARVVCARRQRLDTTVAHTPRRRLDYAPCAAHLRRLAGLEVLFKRGRSFAPALEKPGKIRPDLGRTWPGLAAIPSNAPSPSATESGGVIGGETGHGRGRVGVGPVCRSVGPHRQHGDRQDRCMQGGGATRARRSTRSLAAWKRSGRQQTGLSWCYADSSVPKEQCEDTPSVPK
jgi:hypothetical protein